MKVSVDFGEEINPVIQNHLDTGQSVQKYIRAAVHYFNKMLAIEKDGKSMVGYGDKSRFKSYNTEERPSASFEEI